MRIGELAEQHGVTTKTVRFYEASGLLPAPARTPSGYRSYDDEDARRLAFIKTAQRLGLSLDEIKEILAFRDRGERPCRHVAGVLERQVQDLDRRIGEMRSLRDELQELQSRAAAQEAGGGPDGDYCGVIEHVHLGRLNG